MWMLAVAGMCGMARAHEPRVLARVALKPGAPALTLPAYERLADASGHEYVLVFATLKELVSCGAAYEILDDDGAPDDYVIAVPRTPRARAAAKAAAGVRLDDGRQTLLRVEEADTAALAAQGCELIRLNTQPLDPKTARAIAPTELAIMMHAAGFAPTSLVATMINAIEPLAVSTETARLTGEAPVSIGGTNDIILTRHTTSGEPIAKAAQYVYERFAALGLTPQYHPWGYGWLSNRNVVAVQPGGARSNEVIIVMAHLDNMPAGPRAPGADDNASGCVGVLLIAGQLAAHSWPRTIYYVCVTGEEQGLIGSMLYANMLATRGDNVVAVLNMDMIAWDADLNPINELHTRTIGTADHVADMSIVHTFTNVVAAYGLLSALAPTITMSSSMYSDHYRFWSQGFPAILAIEDTSADFNAYYHTTNDTLGVLNIPYFTAYVKAMLGTAAHLAIGPPLPHHEYDGVVLLEEGFDTPGLPAGWALQVLVNNGTDGNGPLGNVLTVTNVTRSAHPLSFTPHGGTHFARFNAWNAYAGGSVRLARTTPFSTLNVPAAKVLLAWARDNQYADRADELAIEWSTNGTAWLAVTNLTRFCADAECWFEETCWLPPAALGQPAVYLALRFTSQHGNDCHVDSLSVRVVPEPGIVSVLALLGLLSTHRTYRTHRTYCRAEH